MVKKIPRVERGIFFDGFQSGPLLLATRTGGLTMEIKVKVNG